MSNKHMDVAEHFQVKHQNCWKREMQCNIKQHGLHNITKWETYPKVMRHTETSGNVSLRFSL